MYSLSAGERVVVAMSGGVDSSVVAALLREQGFWVIGVTLQLQPCQEGVLARSCCGLDGIRQASQTAHLLGIPHFVFPCAQEFEELVLRSAWQDYARGRTPNPCLVCNRKIKFGLLLDYARRLGAETVATGHYARIRAGRSGETMELYRGRDRNKDQSYFLAGIRPEQWPHIQMPLGEMEKSEVRKLAAKYRLPSAERKESQDACLVQEGQCFAEMLRARFMAPSLPGKIVDTQGRFLAEHAGIHLFTIGQRKGLGVALGTPAWVKEIDAETGNVILTQDPKDLLSAGLKISGLNWLSQPLSSEFAGEVQVRYRHPPQKARIQVCDSGEARIFLEKPVRAVTPGQAAVLYDGDRVLGCGWIDKSYPSS